jgi:hypothetical protein
MYTFLITVSSEGEDHTDRNIAPLVGTGQNISTPWTKTHKANKMKVKQKAGDD